MTTSARNELIEGLKNDLYEFWFLDSMASKMEPIYPKYFTSTEIRGSAEVRNSAMTNVTFKETNGKETVEYTDPVSGRKFVGKLRRHTAATSVERDLFKDASKDALRNMLREWQQSALKSFMLKKEQYYADLLNYAGHTAGNAIYNNSSELFSDPGAGLMYDGKPLLNLSGNARTLLKVPAGVTNSFYNSLGASGKDLTSDNFDDAYTLISSTNAINDAGQREMHFPNVLVVNPALRAEASQIVSTVSGVPGVATNGFNHNFGLVNVALNPFVNSTTAWYLIDANAGQFLAYDKEPPIFDIWFDQETKTYKVSIDIRFGHCVTGFNHIAGGNIATS